MKIKCKYCDSFISDTDEKCPNCGGVNDQLKRVGNDVPKTIDELKQWYIDRNLPDENITRFFIGKDYKEPKAFGIYYDDIRGVFVVYKNKGDGERAIRYEGTDEAYAVNELYLKLKAEILNQKVNGKSHKNTYSWIIYPIISFVLVLFFAFVMSFFPDRGYYNINGSEYYYVDGDWYIYNDNDWHLTGKPEYEGNIDDYYDGYSYSSNGSYSNIEYSSVYDSSWDSDSDWDSSDSWDSGGTDWSGDW